METITFVILASYLLIHLIMFIGILVNAKKPADMGYVPSVSIIICAKDEEDCIEECIQSLLSLNYPKEKLEIVLVNDRSTDRTKEIMLAYTPKNPSLKYFEVTQEHHKLKGKANALAQALKIATGEIIFTTDADIKVNRNWIHEMVKYYDKDTGVVASFSVIEPRNLFWGVQAVDWLYLLSVAAGGDGMGRPISCVGNNMSYSKKAYDKTGGYEKLPFSITEDFLLLHKVNETGYKTRFPINNKTKNITLPCLNYKQLFRQKKRWAAGGMGILNYGILIGVFGWLTGAVILSGWAFLDIRTYIAFLITKLIMDAVFLFPAVKEFKMYKVYLYMVFFEIYFAVYVMITSLMLAVDRKVVWKDQKL